MQRPQLHALSRWQKFGLLTLLYFSQGIPFGLFTQAVPVILRQADMSLKAIGFTALFALPWALKFIWAPWIDRAAPWSAQRRKSWLVPLQILTAVSMLAFGFVDPWKSLIVLGIGNVWLNFLNATQDVATDGLAVDVLEPKDRGLGNGIQVGGYRIGMLFGGAFALWIIAKAGWFMGMVVCAVALLVALIPLLIVQEQPAEAEDESDGTGFLVLWSFIKSPGFLWIVLMLACFKLGDGLAAGMIRPMLVDQGFEMEDIGKITGGVGFTASLIGTGAGAIVAYLLRRPTALAVGTVFQAIGALLYIEVIGESTKTAVAIAVSVENFLGSIATVVLFTCMMDLVRREHSGSDYTVLAVVVVAIQGLGSLLSGYTATWFGYIGHHAAAGIIALIGGALAVLLWVHVLPRTVDIGEDNA